MIHCVQAAISVWCTADYFGLVPPSLFWKLLGEVMVKLDLSMQKMESHNTSMSTHQHMSRAPKKLGLSLKYAGILTTFAALCRTTHSPRGTSTHALTCTHTHTLTVRPQTAHEHLNSREKRGGNSVSLSALKAPEVQRCTETREKSDQIC